MRLRLTHFLVAGVAALAVFAANGQTPPTAPRDELGLTVRTAIPMFGMALLGGLVSWISKVSSGRLNPWSLMHLVGELCTAGFAGSLAYLLCDSLGLNLRLTIGLVGVAGHMGTRAIALFERFAARRWGVIEETQDGSSKN